MRNTTLLILLGLFSFGSMPTIAQQQKTSPPKDMFEVDESEAITKQYLDTFRKTGVPTSAAVAAAVAKAQKEQTIESWTDAAAIANAYANVVGVLCDHYGNLYYASRSGRSDGDHSYLSRAADYEKIRNSYLAIRNDAYIQLAQLYAVKGDRAKALSLVVTAVKLSGAEPNTEGEDLIKQLIGLGDQIDPITSH